MKLIRKLLDTFSAKGKEYFECSICGKEYVLESAFRKHLEYEDFVDKKDLDHFVNSSRKIWQ